MLGEGVLIAQTIVTWSFEIANTYIKQYAFNSA